MRDAAAWLELPMNPHPTRLRRATLSHKRERGGTPNDSDSVIKKARTRRRGASNSGPSRRGVVILVHVASIVPLAHFARRAGVFRRARSGEGRDSRRSRPAAHHRRQEQRAADRLENLQRASPATRRRPGASSCSAWTPIIFPTNTTRRPCLTRSSSRAGSRSTAPRSPGWAGRPRMAACGCRWTTPASSTNGSSNMAPTPSKSPATRPTSRNCRMTISRRRAKPASAPGGATSMTSRPRSMAFTTITIGSFARR